MSAATKEADMETGQEEQAAEAAANGTGEQQHDGGDSEPRSLADLAADEPNVEDEPEQYTLFGTAPKLNGKVGGPRINGAAIKFTAKRETIPGQFEMGDTVRGTFLGTVMNVSFVGKKNSDGSIEQVRVHTVTLERISQAEDVPEEFAMLDGRGTSEDDGEVEQLRARVRELEDLLEK